MKKIALYAVIVVVLVGLILPMAATTPWGTTVLANGTLGRLFVVDGDEDSRIIELNPSTGAILNSFATPAPCSGLGADGLAYGNGRLFFVTTSFVPNPEATTIYEINPDTGAVINSFPAPSNDGLDILGFSGNRLFTLDFTNQIIYVLNPNSGAVITSYHTAANITGGGTFAGTRNSLFFTGWSSDYGIYEIDPADGSVLNFFPLPSPDISDIYGLGFSSMRNTLFIGGPHLEYIYELDPDNGDIINFFPPPANASISALAADEFNKINPSYVSADLEPGETITITKYVITPPDPIGEGTDVWCVVTAFDAGLALNLTPVVHSDVPGETIVQFSETIAVATSSLLIGQTLLATVVFYYGDYPYEGTEIGTEKITIDVIGPDLAITKTDSTDPVVASSALTYTITATNNGVSDATGIVVTDTLPAGVIPVLVIHDGGSISQTSGVVTWYGFDLIRGATKTMSLFMQVASSTTGTLTNLVTIVGNEADPDESNNQFTESTQVTTVTNLEVTKTDNPDPVIVGGTDLTYTITATNYGPSDATGVVVTDTLPAGVTFKSADKGGTCASGVVTWNLGSMVSGAHEFLTVVVGVNVPAVDGTVLNNTVNIAGNDPDPDITNNDYTEDTTVLAPIVHDPKTVTLEIDADGDGAASPGDTLRYTNVVMNDGNGTAFGVMFSDVPDANTTLVAGSVATTQGYVLKGNFQGDKIVEVSLGNMPGHSQATITFAVTINKPLWEPRVANQAIVTSSNFPPVKSDDPGASGLNDPTVTNIKTSPSLPGVTFWGGLALAVLLGVAMVWMVRRKPVSNRIN